MDIDQIEEAMNEMDFYMVDNGIMDLPTSKPAAFSFEEAAELDTDALEGELGEYDFTMFDVMTDRKENGEFHANLHILTDHYKKCSVKFWRKSLRLYPREDGLDTYEFVRIIHAVEDATGSELTHDPIED